ncbi:hypothetical protein F511_30380 [Dorcoceras hygrometricum]|uniref:Uncharacterized protein n=1 Tax=Dorcoceras hygrometricum TaxID=472368 RepID=A0A2Z7C978_9LAMI|nr:hypothetical protein F511_30380 [Dorcoceras hygrometricum]
METSRVDSVVCYQAKAKSPFKKKKKKRRWSWNEEVQQELQCSADEDSADEKRCARYGMSCDDISLDVITISR